MPTTFAKPTYNSIIDDVLQDTNDERLRLLTPEQIQVWIIKAQQRICQLVPCRDQRELRLIQDQVDYEFADSTGLSGTGTISTTGTAVTGVSTDFDDEIIVGSQITAQSQNRSVTVARPDGTGTVTVSGTAVTGVGTLFTTELAANEQITVNGAQLTIASITDNLNLVLTATPDDGFSAATFSRDNHLTIDSAFSPDLSGASYTREPDPREVPTDAKQIYRIDRLEGSFRREVIMKSLNYLLALRIADRVATYTGEQTPLIAAVWTDRVGTLNRYRRLTVYDVPDTDKTVTLYYFLGINPRSHTSDALTANILLAEEFEPSIQAYVKMKMYEWLAGSEGAVKLRGAISKPSLVLAERERRNFTDLIQGNRDDQPPREQIDILYS